MPVNEFCFLYNPSANRNNASGDYRRIAALTKNWPGTKHIITKSAAHLRLVAQKAAEEYRIVVACGGDGTVRAVASTLINKQAILGVIPLGSGNDYIKSLDIPAEPFQALSLLQKRQWKSVDVGIYNGAPFINMVGAGFDGLTNYYASRSSIRAGSIRYAVSALKANLKRKIYEADITVDNRLVYSGKLIMATVANGRVEGGSFLISPDSSLFDGKIEVVIVKPISKWLLPFLLPLFLGNTVKKLPWLEVYSGKNISLKFDKPAPVHADGEQFESCEKEITIEVMPGAIKVIC